METLRNLVFVLVACVGFTAAVYSNPTPAVVVEESAACRIGQCQATAKSTGMRCRHCVSNAGDRFCWQHR